MKTTRSFIHTVADWPGCQLARWQDALHPVITKKIFIIFKKFGTYFFAPYVFLQNVIYFLYKLNDSLIVVGGPTLPSL